MSVPQITRTQFEKRLVDICLRSNLQGLPRKLADRHILLNALTMSLSRDSSYRERQLGDALSSWVDEMCANVQTDHATLRRALCDYGYLSRDREGTTYRVDTGENTHVTFAPEIADIAVDDLISSARADIERRRNMARATAADR